MPAHARAATLPPSPSPSPTFVHTNKRGLELTPPQQANAGKSETDHELLAKEVPNAVKMARYERSLWVDEAAKLAASKHSVKLPEVVANEMIRDEKELGTLKLIGWRNTSAASTRPRSARAASRYRSSETAITGSTSR